MKQINIETFPKRILGMQRLEALFNQKGYLICQSTGKKIYDFEELVAIFIPLSSGSDQVVVVQSEHAKAFMQSCLSTLH